MRVLFFIPEGGVKRPVYGPPSGIFNFLFDIIFIPDKLNNGFRDIVNKNDGGSMKKILMTILAIVAVVATGLQAGEHGKKKVKQNSKADFFAYVGLMANSPLQPEFIKITYGLKTYFTQLSQQATSCKEKVDQTIEEATDDEQRKMLQEWEKKLKLEELGFILNIILEARQKAPSFLEKLKKADFKIIYQEKGTMEIKNKLFDSWWNVPRLIKITPIEELENSVKFSVTEIKGFKKRQQKFVVKNYFKDNFPAFNNYFDEHDPVFRNRIMGLLGFLVIAQALTEENEFFVDALQKHLDESNLNGGDRDGVKENIFVKEKHVKRTPKTKNNAVPVKHMIKKNVKPIPVLQKNKKQIPAKKKVAAKVKPRVVKTHAKLAPKAKASVIPAKRKRTHEKAVKPMPVKREVKKQIPAKKKVAAKAKAPVTKRVVKNKARAKIAPKKKSKPVARRVATKKVNPAVAQRKNNKREEIKKQMLARAKMRVIQNRKRTKKAFAAKGNAKFTKRANRKVKPTVK